MIKYTREELIEICKNSIVHHTKWNDRDSHIAQCEINSIHEGLTAGFDFKIDKETDDETIWISFVNIDFNKIDNGESLEINDVEDYFRDCDPEYETEMFEGYGIDFKSNYTRGFMPTRKKLNDSDGEDWY